MREDLDQRVRERAFQLWDEEGRPDGKENDHWARAAAELQGSQDHQQDKQQDKQQGNGAAPQDPLQDPQQDQPQDQVATPPRNTSFGP